VILALLMQSTAYSMDYTSFESAGMEASLLIQRYETKLNVDNSIIESRYNKVGVIIYEPSYKSFQPGLQLGALEINQSNNPVTAGISPTGNYIGVLFRSQFYSGGSLGLQLDGSYAYYSADKAKSDQEVNLNWHELIFYLSALSTYDDFYITFGAYSQLIDGDETAFGSITQTRQFNEDKRSGIHFEFHYWVDATGKIGIIADSGGRQGIGLVFTREF
jgi:hypothetical protein